MADDLEQLILSISAETTQILNSMKRLIAQTQQDTNAITAYF